MSNLLEKVSRRNVSLTSRITLHSIGNSSNNNIRLLKTDKPQLNTEVLKVKVIDT